MNGVQRARRPSAPTAAASSASIWNPTSAPALVRWAGRGRSVGSSRAGTPASRSAHHELRSSARRSEVAHVLAVLQREVGQRRGAPAVVGGDLGAEHVERPAVAVDVVQDDAEHVVVRADPTSVTRNGGAAARSKAALVSVETRTGPPLARAVSRSTVTGEGGRRSPAALRPPRGTGSAGSRAVPPRR